MAGVRNDAKKSGDDSRSSSLPELNPAFVLPFPRTAAAGRLQIAELVSGLFFLTAMSSANFLG